MICDAIREQLSLYAGGDLPANDAEAVAEHLAGCADCRRRVAELQEMIPLVGLAANEARYPSAQLPRVRWSRQPVWRATVAAALVGAILIGTQVPAVVALGEDVMGWVKSFRNLSVHQMTPAEAERFQQPIKPDPPGTWDENAPPGDTESRTLPLAEIEAQIDYNLLKPTYLPKGFQFEKSSYIPLFQDVLLEYSGPAGQVILHQSNPFRPGSTWVKAPEVEMVRVGNGEGALTRSVMRVESSTGEIHELPRIALYVEREDGRVVSVDWSDPDYPVAEIVKLVESLYAPPEPIVAEEVPAAEPVQTCFATKPGKQTGSTSGGRYEPMPLADIEAKTGWRVLMPTYLPGGFYIGDSLLHPTGKDVIVEYNGPMASIVVAQEPVDGDAPQQVDAPECAQEKVRVGDMEGVMVTGGWHKEPDGSWTWTVADGGRWLEFVKDGWKIAIIDWRSPRLSGAAPQRRQDIIIPEEMIRMAESLQ